MIIKFNPAGRVVWVFGRRKEGADEDAKPWEHPDPPLAAVDGLFRQPTDVAWDSDGNIYISDGYVNSRVAKYDKDGDWVKSWGEKGTGPGQFRIAARDCRGPQQQLLCGGSHQPACAGVRHRRQISADVYDRCAARSEHARRQRQHADGRAAGSGDRRARTRCASRPGPTRCCSSARRTFPGRIFKVSLDGKVLGVIGKSGRKLKAILRSPSAGVPVGKRKSTRRRPPTGACRS